MKLRDRKTTKGNSRKVKVKKMKLPEEDKQMKLLQERSKRNSYRKDGNESPEEIGQRKLLEGSKGTNFHRANR